MIGWHCSDRKLKLCGGSKICDALTLRVSCVQPFMLRVESCRGLYQLFFVLLVSLVASRPWNAFDVNLLIVETFRTSQCVEQCRVVRICGLRVAMFTRHVLPRNESRLVSSLVLCHARSHLVWPLGPFEASSTGATALVNNSSFATHHISWARS